MTIPTWAIFTGIPVLYFLIGIVLAMLMAYRAGRHGDYTFDGFDGRFWTFLWPILCVIHCINFVTGKYDAFLRRIREYGAESVLPPKNECDGRRVS